VGSLGVSLGSAPDAPSREQVLASSVLLSPTSLFWVTALRYRIGQLNPPHARMGWWRPSGSIGSGESGGPGGWSGLTQSSTDADYAIWLRPEPSAEAAEPPDHLEVP
jgi:hypothetical protein